MDLNLDVQNSYYVCRILKWWRMYMPFTSNAAPSGGPWDLTIGREPRLGSTRMEKS